MNSDGATAGHLAEKGRAENGIDGNAEKVDSHAAAASNGVTDTHVNGNRNTASPSSARISMAALCSPVSSPRPLVNRDASSSSIASTSRNSGTSANTGTKPRTRRESAAAQLVAAAEAGAADQVASTSQQGMAEPKVNGNGASNKTVADYLGAVVVEDTAMTDASHSRSTEAITISSDDHSDAAPRMSLDGNDASSESDAVVKIAAASTAGDEKRSDTALADEADKANEDDNDEEGDDDEEDEDDDDEDDDDDDDDEDEDEGEGSENGTAKSDMEGIETPSGSPQSKGKARATPEDDAAAEANLNGDAQANNGAETSKVAVVKSKPGPKPKGDKSKKKAKRERSPSIDVSLPAGPPPRPTMRMKLSIAKTDDDQYLLNVPEEMFRLLKPKNDPWAEWYERSQAEDTSNGAADASGTETPNAEGEAPPDLESLGDLARLLHKYPAESSSAGAKKGKKKKKGKGDDIYEIGQYDTKDPFVDDSELGVDEPTHQAKPTSDGFFVSKGEVQLERIKRDEAAQQSRDSLMSNLVGTRRSQIPVGFGEATDGYGGAGALFLQAGTTVTCSGIVNVMISQQAVDLGILTPPAEGETPARTSYFGINALLNGNGEPSSSLSGPSEPSSSRDMINGSRQSPIKVDDDRRSTPMPNNVGGANGKTFKYPAAPVPERLEREFENIRVVVHQTSWREKAKFPPTLREPLFRAARVSIALNEYNENFFNWLPRLIPYNRLTLHKYVKRHFVEDHVALMRKVQEKHFEGFKQQVQDLWPIVKKDHDEKIADYVAKGGKVTSTPAPEASGSASQDAAQARNGDGDAIDEEPAEGAAEAPVVDGSEPVKRWPWTEPLRETLFTIMTIDNAMNEVRSEKYGLENSNERTSTINSRKVIYKRMCEFWPEDGWISTTNLSNTYGLYKRKVDRFAAMLDEARGRDQDHAIAL